MRNTIMMSRIRKRNAGATSHGEGPSRRAVLKGAAAAGGAAAAAWMPPRVHAQSGKLDIVKGTLTPLVAYAHVYSAIEKGFFAKYGIQNQIDSVAIAASLPIVARGDYDWGRSSNGAGYFNALNSGLAIVGAVDRLTYICSADNGLVVSKKNYDAGVRSFADLKGKTVAVNAPGTANDYWVAQSLAKNKMAKSDIKLVYLSYPDMLAAMSSGSADAGYLPEPLMTKGIEEGRINLVEPIIKVAPGDNIGMMFFGAKFIEKSGGDIATRWLMAYLEGIRFAQNPKNRDEVIKIVAKETRLEPDLVGKIYDRRISWPQVEPNGRVDAERMLKTLGNFFLEAKQIDKLPDARRVFDPTQLQAALKQVGEVRNDEHLLCKL